MFTSWVCGIIGVFGIASVDVFTKNKDFSLVYMVQGNPVGSYISIIDI